MCGYKTKGNFKIWRGTSVNWPDSGPDMDHTTGYNKK